MDEPATRFELLVAQCRGALPSALWGNLERGTRCLLRGGLASRSRGRASSRPGAGRRSRTRSTPTRPRAAIDQALSAPHARSTLDLASLGFVQRHRSQGQSRDSAAVPDGLSRTSMDGDKLPNCRYFEYPGESGECIRGESPLIRTSFLSHAVRGALVTLFGHVGVA
jgi:hypothetical protein